MSVSRKYDPESTDPPVVLEEQPADNGPAVLRALLLGFDIDVPLAELRQRLDLEPDGTSIDDIEELANQLGLQAEQGMMPVEHVTLARPGCEDFPLIAVVEDEFEGLLFLLVWRVDGNRVQVVHTTDGAFWLPKTELERWLYRHSHSYPIKAWVHDSAANGFMECVEQRLVDFGVTPDQADVLAKRARSVPGLGPAALDAAIRYQRIKNPTTPAALEATFEAWLVEPGLVPREHWFARPPGSDSDEVELHGAVVLTARRRPPSGWRRWSRWFSRTE